MKLEITIDEINELQLKHERDIERAYQNGYRQGKDSMPSYRDALIDLFSNFAQVRGASDKIQAIKKFRDLTRLELREAKKAIEAIYWQEHWYKD